MKKEKKLQEKTKVEDTSAMELDEDSLEAAAGGNVFYDSHLNKWISANLDSDGNSIRIRKLEFDTREEAEADDFMFKNRRKLQ